jgi:hypothetical protein
MKLFLLLLINVFLFSVLAKSQDFTVKNISLPPEIAYYDNQFSGLYVYEGKLFVMSESRLQDNAEAKLYSIALADLDRKMADTSFVLPFKKYHIYNLDLLRENMQARGDDYEGLEAIAIKDNDVYLSVETATASNNCYLLKGQLSDTAVVMDLKVMLPLPKPITLENKHIYNAGFEAITLIDESIVSVFEYNYFEMNNCAIAITPWSYMGVSYQKNPVEAIPFRITDITKTSKNSFTAVNFFYKGDGDDEVYRVPKKDKVNDKLIRDGFGYKNYCRLVKLKYKNAKFSWEPLWEFPVAYMGYNWEGIAAYKEGYFIINDKYTPARPYSSVLLYLAPNSSK